MIDAIRDREGRFGRYLLVGNEYYRVMVMVLSGAFLLNTRRPIIWRRISGCAAVLAPFIGMPLDGVLSVSCTPLGKVAELA